MGSPHRYGLSMTDGPTGEEAQAAVALVERDRAETEFGAMTGPRTFPEGSDAYTIGEHVFCRDRCEGPLLAHEKVHVQQFRRMGSGFAIRYGIETLRNGTRCENRYEVPAYALNRPC